MRRDDSDYPYFLLIALVGAAVLVVAAIKAFL